MPDVSNRVASGLTGTSWTDTAAPVGTTVWYVVRARNDESCTGGAGLEDGNLIVLCREYVDNRAVYAPRDAKSDCYLEIAPDGEVVLRKKVVSLGSRVEMAVEKAITALLDDTRFGPGDSSPPVSAASRTRSPFSPSRCSL